MDGKPNMPSWKKTTLMLDIHNMKNIYHLFTPHCSFAPALQLDYLSPKNSYSPVTPSAICFAYRFIPESVNDLSTNKNCKISFQLPVPCSTIIALLSCPIILLDFCCIRISFRAFDLYGTEGNVLMISWLSGSSFPFISWVNFPCHRGRPWCQRVLF